MTFVVVRVILPPHQAHGTLFARVKRLVAGCDPRHPKDHTKTTLTLRLRIEHVSGPVLELARTDALFPPNDTLAAEDMKQSDADAVAIKKLRATGMSKKQARAAVRKAAKAEARRPPAPPPAAAGKAIEEDQLAREAVEAYTAALNERLQNPGRKEEEYSTPLPTPAQLARLGGRATRGDLGSTQFEWLHTDGAVQRVAFAMAGDGLEVFLRAPRLIDAMRTLGWEDRWIRKKLEVRRSHFNISCLL